MKPIVGHKVKDLVKSDHLIDNPRTFSEETNCLNFWKPIMNGELKDSYEKVERIDLVGILINII